MLRSSLLLLAGLAGLPLLITSACGTATGTGGSGGDAGTGSVIVGLTSDLRPGVDIEQVHVVMTAAGSVLEDEVLSASSTTMPLAIPGELGFLDLPGGTPVEITLDAFSPGNSATPLVTRRASTEIVAGKKLLYRVELDSRCVAAPGSSAPVCTTPETCVAGVCRDEHVAATKLEVYTPTWDTVSSDPCKPAGSTPVVIVGEGQGDYLPEMDGDTAQVEAGPQGGHHIWVALRAKGLSQSGSITSISGHFPDLDLDVGPFNVIFTMDPDEGGFCKLYGLRFQLDQNTDIATLLGHPLDVTVTVTDPQMSVGVGKRSVVLSTSFMQ